MFMNKIIHKIAEECSRDSGSIDELSLLHLRPYIEGFLDSNWLDINIDEYETWAKKYSDPSLQRKLLHRPIGMNILVAMIWAARSWQKEYSLDLSFQPTNGAKSLIGISCSLAVLELHSSHYLDSQALKYIQARMQSLENSRRNPLDTWQRNRIVSHFVTWRIKRFLFLSIDNPQKGSIIKLQYVKLL